MEDFLFSVAILVCIFIVFIQTNDFGVESMTPPKNALFGDRPFGGVLPLPWPSHSEQLPIATDGGTADETSVLFPRYFGLKK